LSTYGTSGSNQGEFLVPTSINFDSEGNFYVSELGISRVRFFSSEGQYLGEVGTGLFEKPHGLTFDSAGFLYITDTGNNVVRKFQRN